MSRDISILSPGRTGSQNADSGELFAEKIDESELWGKQTGSLNLSLRLIPFGGNNSVNAIGAKRSKARLGDHHERTI